ncbi:MAG: hypothetical protein CMJ78_04970 [Planctomycetaceae bacterium]|nr:hypothetical protein [Planctomycetaceae bacterium]
MYEQYWGLSKNPFLSTLEQTTFQATGPHDEALSRLLYLTENQRRFGLLIGPAGTGKSSLLNTLNKQVARGTHQLASLDTVGLSSHELLWQVAVALHLAPAESVSRWNLWRMIDDHVSALAQSGIHWVLLVDHLERADADCLPLLERLLHRSPSLTVIAAVRTSGLAAISPVLSELSELRIELTPLDRTQTADFITGLLAQAGCQREVFLPSAVDSIFRHSVGIPRGITRLCDLSLLAGMSEECQQIGEDIVESAAYELQYRTRPAAALSPATV